MFTTNFIATYETIAFSGNSKQLTHMINMVADGMGGCGNRRHSCDFCCIEEQAIAERIGLAPKQMEDNHG